MSAGLLAALLLAAVLPARAGLLTAEGVVVLDQTGTQRASFSTNETIGFQQVVNNGVASSNRIFFQFAVVAPNGNTVFRHVGNSVRGTVGNASSQVSGVPISGFAQGPGTYTLKATASLDAQTLEQDQTFAISSPNILLIYPPNGSQNLTDNPLTFQWYSSGASSYRVTVGNNPSLYNAYFTQTTPTGATSLTYPQNPSDSRARLSTGQTYWWNVAGLDASGNVVAQSQVPFSFSVANTSLTRDLAVTGLTVTGPPDPSGNIPFLVTITNQGNTTETNTPLRMTVGGVTVAGSPVSVPLMTPSDVKTFPFSAPIPTDMNTGLAIACLTLFDDNVNNNCMTLSVTRPTASVSTATFSSAAEAPLTADQTWQAIQQLLLAQGIDLSGYNLTSMEGSMTPAEMTALLNQLRSGQAQATVTGSGAVAPPPVVSPLPETSAVFPSTAPAAAEPQTVSQEQSWSGASPPMSDETVTVAVTSESNWDRLWRRLSPEPVPLIDFSQHVVIAIMAGGKDGADRVMVDDYETDSAQLTVSYRLISYPQPFLVNAVRSSGATQTAPYTLVVIPRTVLKVKFKLESEGGSNEKK